MKKYFFWISIVIIFWVSCEPPVIFKSPQPEGIQQLTAFSPEFRGTYTCESDSSVVIISEDVVYKTEWFDFMVTQNRIDQDPNFEKIGKFLFVKDVGKCTINKIEDDIVYVTAQLADTLFLLDGEECILKSYKGHQVMSLKLLDESYEVIILSLDADANLELKMATLPGELEQLEKITTVKDVSSEDVEQYKINPSLMEFDEILKQELVFETCEYFKRVKIPNLDLYVF